MTIIYHVGYYENASPYGKYRPIRTLFAAKYIRDDERGFDGSDMWPIETLGLDGIE